MDHKSFLIQLQSRLGKDKGEIDSYMSAFLQILKERCSQMDTVAIQPNREKIFFRSFGRQHFKFSFNSTPRFK